MAGRSKPSEGRVSSRSRSGGGTFTRAELADGLRAVGIAPGDVVFTHVSLDGLGQPAGCKTSDDAAALVLGALRDVVGARGTILVPTYTFSFCRQQPFDVQRTPTQGGPWSPSATILEYVRRQSGAIRSRDPIHSVVGIGPRAAELLHDVPPTCFGKGSVFDRLRRAGGKVCTLGLGLHEGTFLHHVEETVGVPFRFKKMFSGTIRSGEAQGRTGWVYFVRLLDERSEPNEHSIEKLARSKGVCRAAPVGRGEVLAVETQPYFDLIAGAIARDPWVTARGPAADPVELEAARVCDKIPEIRLPRDATAEQIVDALWRLPRNIVSEAYDVALRALATQLPMQIHEYPTGTEAWTWIVPEKWTCHEAYVETMDGRRLFAYADNPLHVVSYSLPFDGVVSRETLLAHLYVHPILRDAVPFQFKYYDRDWGMCCAARQREQLTDDQYRVVIRTDFSYGTLKVGEAVLPGESPETIVLCAHLCHPGMFNDDLSGVVVGLEVMRQLQRRARRRYTYRLVIVPETIGSVAYLADQAALIPHMKGGIFLEMLGLDNPHALQLSFEGNAEIDECCSLTLARKDPYAWTAPFRGIIGNDERQYNAPGVRVPMLSLSRVLRMSHPQWPYPEYHSSADVPTPRSFDRLRESRDLVLAMLDALEDNAVLHNLYSGEVFCSRYGIQLDYWNNRQGYDSLFDIMYMIDGTRSIAQIARTCDLGFEAVRDTAAELARHGLVRMEPTQRAP